MGAEQFLGGRYALATEIASGGMASIFLGKASGAAGFARTVAIKRLHPHFAKDATFVAMLMDEARMASKIHHANVIPTLDVVQSRGEVCLVLEYVHGVALSTLMRVMRTRGERAPLDVALAIAIGALQGLHAAHEAKDDDGTALEIVHRDVSPQNVLVGADGTARVFDFGVAKAVGRLYRTTDGRAKGKCGYMAPEQIESVLVDRRADLFSFGVVLWELLAGERLFDGPTDAVTLARVLAGTIPRVSERRSEVPAALDALVARALSRDPSGREATALAMVGALEASGVVPASSARVGEWVRELGGDLLLERTAALATLAQVATRAPALETSTATAPAVSVGSESLPNFVAALRGTVEREADVTNPVVAHRAAADELASAVEPVAVAPVVAARAPRSVAPSRRSTRIPLAVGAALGVVALLAIGLVVSRRSDASNPSRVGARVGVAATDDAPRASSSAMTAAPPPLSSELPAPPESAAHATASSISPASATGPSAPHGTAPNGLRAGRAKATKPARATDDPYGSSH